MKFPLPINFVLFWCYIKTDMTTLGSKLNNGHSSDKWYLFTTSLLQKWLITSENASGLDFWVSYEENPTCAQVHAKTFTHNVQVISFWNVCPNANNSMGLARVCPGGMRCAQHTHIAVIQDLLCRTSWYPSCVSCCDNIFWWINLPHFSPNIIVILSKLRTEL